MPLNLLTLSGFDFGSDFIVCTSFLRGPLNGRRKKEILPEIRSTEDNIGSFESWLEGLDVIEVTCDDLGPFFNPCLRRRLARITGDASDFPSGQVDKNIGNRGTLVSFISLAFQRIRPVPID